MEKAKNVMSKMSQAALKAWETRRKNAGSSSIVGENEKKEKRKDKSVKEVSNESNVGFKADEKREMMILNGVEVLQLAMRTQRHLDRKQAFDEAKNGKQGGMAVEAGGFVKKIKVKRFSGGVELET